jgi:hypothetical protein
LHYAQPTNWIKRYKSLGQTKLVHATGRADNNKTRKQEKINFEKIVTIISQRRRLLEIAD